MTPELNRSVFSVDGNNIRILKSDLLPLNMQVFDMTGKLIQTCTLKTGASFRLDVVPGNYVLRLSNDQKAGSFVIPIQ